MIHGQYECIIVESHNDILSQWGEIIAKELKGKHIIILMDEYYRGKKQYYTDKIDFYIYKLHRKEIMGSLEVTERLFEGYLHVSENDFNNFEIAFSV